MNRVREMKAALTVRRGMRREEEDRRRRGGKSESTADQQHLPVDTGTTARERLTDHQRDTVVCRLASEGAAKTDPTEMAPRCGRKIPKLSSVCKVSQCG